MPAILATQEAEIKRTMVPSRKIKSATSMPIAYLIPSRMRGVRETHPGSSPVFYLTWKTQWNTKEWHKSVHRSKVEGYILSTG
jgi:hypothetical protein